MKKILLFLVLTLFPSAVFAGGFESGENTSIANARGGTGVVSRTDSAAMLFNPSLLAESEGLHFTIDVNLLNQNLSFHRNPLVTKLGTTEFEEVQNESSFFPIPFFAASYDFDTDYFALGFALFGPHSYGNTCMTEIVDGECVTEKDNGARHMLIGSDLIVGFAFLGASLAFQAGEGSILIGAGGGVAAMSINKMDIFIDQVNPPIGSPYNENSNFGGRFDVRDARDFIPAYNFGLSYISEHFRIGFSGRPSLKWNPKGKFKIEIPKAIKDFVTFSNDDISVQLNQAGSYRLGVGWFGGTHPLHANKTLFDVELNIVYENWGVVDNYKTVPHSDLDLLGETLKINPVFLAKNYQDTYSMRLGASYAISNLFTLHGGGFIETAAQTITNTNADFVSWERYSGSAGLSFEVSDFIDLTLSYAHIFSPSREVRKGNIYQQIPLSQCVGPDYQNPLCSSPGTPPGTPQNEGTWTTSSQVIGAGIQVHFE